MSGTSNSEQGFPITGAPLVDPRNGMMTQPWLQFFIALWNRTGGAGGMNINVIQAVSAMSDLADDSNQDVASDTTLLAAVIEDPVQPDLFPETLLQALMAGTEDPQLSLQEMLLNTTALTNEAQTEDPDQATLKAMMSVLEEEGPAPQVPHPGYVSGRFYPAWDGNIGATGAIGAVDTIYLYPFYVAEDIQITALFMRVVTAGAGSSAKAGIWMNKNGRPTGTPVVVDNTGVSTAATGYPTFTFTPTVLRKGWYWVGTKFTGTLPVCTNIVGTSLLMSSRIGGTSNANAVSNGATNQASGQSFADAYANNMPDLTSATLVDVVGAAAGIPVLGFSVA